MRLSLIALLAAVIAFAQQPSEITGDYIEGRSNHVYTCYCEWSGEQVAGGREVILAWDVKSGGYRGVALAGVKMAAVLVGEATLSYGSNPRKSILFFDSAASNAQRAAAEGLLREKYARLLGDVRAVHSIPIEFRRDAERAALRIGNLLHLALRKAVLPDDVLQGSILWYDPFIPLTETTLGTNLSHSYRGEEFNHRWENSEPGTTGYFGRFELALN